MAWKGIEGDSGIYFSQFQAGEWNAQANVPGVGTSVHPALAVFNGELFMAWKGIPADDGIYFSNFNEVNWAGQQKVPGVGTSDGPALAGRLQQQAVYGVERDRWGRGDLLLELQ
jgi:hypothetical protein